MIAGLEHQRTCPVTNRALLTTKTNRTKQKKKKKTHKIPQQLQQKQNLQ